MVFSIAVILASSRSRRWIRLAAIGIIFAALVGMTISWWVAGRLVQAAKHSVGSPPVDLEGESLSLSSESGAALAGWYFPNPRNSGTVVLLHPIRGSRLSMLDRARLFHQAGYSVLMVDLQAHGESTGNVITMGFLERHDATAAVELAKRLNPGQPVAVVGWSLGGVAAILASPLGIDALILESVYPTIEDAIDNRVRARLGLLSPLATTALLFQLQPRLGIAADQLRPIDKLDQVDCPVLLMGGSEDWHTTVEELQRIYVRAGAPRQLEIFPGAAHTDLQKFDANRYAEATLKFLEDHLGTSELKD